MSINEFHSWFTSQPETVQERSSLFAALRRVSRLEAWTFLAKGNLGWAEWPPMAHEGREAAVQLPAADRLGARSRQWTVGREACYKAHG